MSLRNAKEDLVINRGKHSILGILVDAVDYDAATEMIIDAAQGRCPFAATALATHGVMAGVLYSNHRYPRVSPFQAASARVSKRLEILWRTRLSEG